MPQLIYIKEFLSNVCNAEELKNIDELESAFFKNEQIPSFIHNFIDDSFFDQSRSRTFLSRVRNAIKEFEKKSMETTQPKINAWLWQQRREEIFFIKYFCVRAVEVGSDNNLAQFIVHFIKKTEWAFLSQYNELLKSLSLINSKLIDGEYFASFSKDREICEKITAMNDQIIAITDQNQLIKTNECLNLSIIEKDKKISEMQVIIDDQASANSKLKLELDATINKLNETVTELRNTKSGFQSQLDALSERINKVECEKNKNASPSTDSFKRKKSEGLFPSH